MKKRLLCASCNAPLQPGYLPGPPHGPAGALRWFPGLPKAPRKASGGTTGAADGDASEALPVTAFRCPTCGELRLLA